MVYVIEFFLFSLAGWVVDSLYCTIAERRFVWSGYFRGLPLCPIYGFGGILLVNSFGLLHEQPAWLVIGASTLLVIALEYVGGWLAEHLLDEKLWDYSNQPWNLQGYISAWHSFLWLVAVSGLYWLLGAQISTYQNWMNQTFTLGNNELEALLVFAVVVGAFFLTSHHKKLRRERQRILRGLGLLEQRNHRQPSKRK